MVCDQECDGGTHVFGGGGGGGGGRNVSNRKGKFKPFGFKGSPSPLFPSLNGKFNMPIRKILRRMLVLLTVMI